MTDARAKFVKGALDHIDETVLMGALDCSELVALGFIAAGGADQTKTHTAQRYFNETRALLPEEKPIPGDLGFYGTADDKVVHVVICLAGGHVLSADGATRSITDLEVAKSKGARVRVHPTPLYRDDVPFRGWRRFTALDALDDVTR